MSEKHGEKDLDDDLIAKMLEEVLKEIPENLDHVNLNLIQLEMTPEDELVIEEIFRAVHTIKGSASFVNLDEITAVAKKMEEVFREVRKGSFKITGPIINVLYEGLDVLVMLTNKAKGDDSLVVDIKKIMRKLDMIPDDIPSELEKIECESEPTIPGSQELMTIYQESYNQLAALKHIVYSSTHLTDPQSLAVLFSKQIHERMTAERNEIWLVEDGKDVVAIARDGEPSSVKKRRRIEIRSSAALRRVIEEQLVVWPSSLPEVKEIFSEFESPTLFPIKGSQKALGFLVLDPEEKAEVEVYQFVGQFAAMVLNISRLHQQVETQKEELNEMTEILFRQNAHLSSLYHVELDLMQVTDPAGLCQIVADAVVNELEVTSGAVFLLNESRQELNGMAAGGDLTEIDKLKISVADQKVFKRVIESGRVIDQKDFPEALLLGQNRLMRWRAFPIKGKEGVNGILVIDTNLDDDISDSVSILVNYTGIVLENLTLKKNLELKR
jgi:chemotaxis protein histidine kinase CheA